MEARGIQVRRKKKRSFASARKARNPSQEGRPTQKGKKTLEEGKGLRIIFTVKGTPLLTQGSSRAMEGTRGSERERGKQGERLSMTILG